MKKRILYLLVAFMTATLPVVAAMPSTTMTSNFSKANEEAFYQQLQAGLKKSQDRVNQLQGSSGIQNEMNLETAQATLAIKQTMFANFKGTPAIQFPEIRDRLLALFQRDEVGAEDLALLQQAIYDWEQSAHH